MPTLVAELAPTGEDTVLQPCIASGIGPAQSKTAYVAAGNDALFHALRQGGRPWRRSTAP